MFNSQEEIPVDEEQPDDNQQLTQAVRDEQRKRKIDEIQNAVVDLATQPKKSNWLEKIRREQLDKEKKAMEEKEERARMLKAVLDSESDDANDELKFEYD